MQIDATTLPGVLVLTPRRFSDSRGWFSETWNSALLRAEGIDLAFVQDNESVSLQTGTVRGLHFQRPPRAQAKLVRVVTGAIWDVAVDARVGSPTYGQWVGMELSAENGRQLLIPEGFLHGFVTRVPNTRVAYKCSDLYDASCDGAVLWSDPDLGIDWGIGAGEAVVSDKDRSAPRWAGWSSPFAWQNAA